MKEVLFAKLQALNLPALFNGKNSWFGVDYAIIALLFAVVLFLFTCQMRKNRHIQIRYNTVDGILARFNLVSGLESNLSQLLELIIPVVEAPGYFFYILDTKHNNYHLKAVRHSDLEGGQISPSYSGLLPFKKEKYNPPLAIPAGNILSRPAIIQDGAVPMLMMNVKGGMGLITVGPIRKISKQSIEILAFLCQKIQSTIDGLIEIEKMKSQVESVLASSQAIQYLTKSAFDLDGSLTIILGLSIKMTGAAGGCFLYKRENSIELALSLGLAKEVEEQLQQDHESRYLLYNLRTDQELLLINREMKEYFYVPSYLAALGLDTLIVTKASGNQVQGTALFWFTSPPDLNKHRLAALQLLMNRLGDALDRQLKFEDMANSYQNTLKMLVDTLDNIEPYTVSHSEIISRYCGIIARELGLEEKDIKDIMLAGYLHDVGMLGLSGDILFKSGQYSEIEFETMKLHTEVGATIVESTLSKENVAAYIKHHHERWDGYGYPAGLKGEEIPLGARIIAVADMFNAKITGRKYREPANFESAIADLRAVSGLQLDPEMVEALINWFSKKQFDPSRGKRSLGPCWEMNCCPSTISRYCPAYKNTDSNCWQVEGTHCTAHGKTCQSCVVFSEYKYRTEKLQSVKQ